MCQKNFNLKLIPMKKLRIRESKVEAFMKKRGYKDMYDMKDRLIIAGYEPEIVPDGTLREKLAIVWWWMRKVLSFVVSAIYLPIYWLAKLLFGLVSIVRGLVLFLMLEPARAARCFRFPFNHLKQ